MNLKDTVEMMNSEDYKERFKRIAKFVIQRKELIGW